MLVLKRALGLYDDRKVLFGTELAVWYGLGLGRNCIDLVSDMMYNQSYLLSCEALQIET